MRSRPATLASIVVLVLVLGLVIAVVGREALLPPDDPLMFPTRDVVIAVRPIAAGTRIVAEMIAMRTVPIDDTNSMAYVESPQVLGKVAAIDILELQLVTPNLLVAE